MDSSSNHYDIIVVGSGTAGATLTKTLSQGGKRVLLLEKGKTRPIKESLLGIAPIMNAVKVSDDLVCMRGLNTGGSSSLYFAVADLPPVDFYQSLGIDLSPHLESAKKEIPLGTLPDHFLGPQVLRLKETATSMGLPWEKKLMAIDQAQCSSGYDYSARWRARSFVNHALENGATLVTNATVSKVLVKGGRAEGVEYVVSGPFSKKTHRVFAEKVILSAGALATPLLLRQSGISAAGTSGFYCCPNFAVLGFVPDLDAKESFVGSMAADLGNGLVIGDANLSRFFFKMVMMSEGKLNNFWSFKNAMTIGGSVTDEISGGIDKNGRYRKTLTESERNKLLQGEDLAIEILNKAGAKKIMRFNYASANVGGLVRIKEHVGEDLETEIKNLYVCDGSVIPKNIALSPTLTLVCLAKYLGNRLLN